MLAIIDPPEADCFSFAARSAANENNIFLCDLCGSSPRRFLRGRAVNALNLFRINGYVESATHFVLLLITRDQKEVITDETRGTRRL
jgi:hypothetical protein